METSEVEPIVKEKYDLTRSGIIEGDTVRIVRVPTLADRTGFLDTDGGTRGNKHLAENVGKIGEVTLIWSPNPEYHSEAAQVMIEGESANNYPTCVLKKIGKWKLKQLQQQKEQKL